MSIWFKKPSIKEWKDRIRGTFTEYVGVKHMEFLEDSLRGELVVDQNNMQGFGMLHGGVAITFADSLVGFAASNTIDNTKFMMVTIDMNISYIRPGWPGVLKGEAKPLHLGKSTQVWSVEVYNEDGKLQTVSRLTYAILPIREVGKEM